MKKAQPATTLALTRNTDILATISTQRPDVFTVGFAAETDDLARYSRGTMAEKKLDMIAANWVGGERGFDSESNALQVYWADGDSALEEAPKSELARRLVKLIAERYLQSSTVRGH